jgi:type VI secretion system protein ImpJ
MMNFSRVVWSEGMHLGPHHFQAQNRYFEDCIHFAASSLWFAPYGFAGWALDSEALRNGTLSLVHARGIFPDGLAFHMPEYDVLPPARNIANQISPIRDSVTVLLAIPRRKPEGSNVSEPQSITNETRYVADIQSLHDENTGRDEKPVTLARKNFSLMLDDEVSDAVIALPIARVMRDGAGHLIVDPDFVPPCLNIGGSDRLMTMLRRLIEILEEKSATLFQAGGTGTRSFSQQELAKYWLLHAVNSNLAPLRHLYFAKRGHPEELYLALARLAGALCTFGLESDPRQLPLYAHEGLTDCFLALDQQIRIQLETVIPTNFLTVALLPAEKYIHIGKITDPRCLGRSRWVFGIEAKLGEVDLISKTPHSVKICSRAFIGKLVERALPGLALTHLPSPPPSISPRLEAQYFGVTKSGACWDHILETREIGVYVPGELTNPRIELFVVLEN